MANSATLASLRVQTLDYADMTGSKFPVQKNVRWAINNALGELHTLLVDSYEDYLRSVGTINLVTGTELYALPTDFYKCLGMYYIDGDRRYSIPKYNRKEVDGFKRGAVTAGEVEIEYVPQFTPLVEDYDTVNVSVPVLWEDFVAMSAAVRLLMREESDASQLIREREAMRERMIDAAEPRDAANTGVTEDVYNRWGIAVGIYSNWRNLTYRIVGDNVAILEFESRGA